MKRNAFLSLLLLASFTMGCQLKSNSLVTLVSATPAQTAGPSQTVSPVPSSTPAATQLPSPSARLGAAERSLFIGDYDQALQDYQAALEQAADDETKAGALTGIGRVYYSQNNYADALTSINLSLQDYPNSAAAPVAYYYRAQINEFQKDFIQAASDYEQYVKLRPGVLNAYMQEARGDDLMAGGDPDAAITAYQSAVEAPRLSDPVYVQIKIANVYASNGDFNTAIREYMKIYDATTNDYVKAQMDLLAGRVYLKMALKEQAEARFQDAVNNYPRAYDSYTALSTLLDAGAEVNQLSRGLIDYYVGQYGVTIDVLTRYINSDPDHKSSAHYYLGLALRQSDRYNDAITEFDALIKDHPGDSLLADAYREKAYTQWAYLDRYDYGAETLLNFVKLYPTDPNDADFLFEAGRIYERDNRLKDAANTWGRLINEFPAADASYRGLFLSGITHYRQKDYQEALTIFQRCLLLATNPFDQSQAYFWIGKTALVMENQDAAQQAFEQGAQRDPTGYYSERSRDLLQNRSILNAAAAYDLGYDLEQERPEAETWIRKTFSLPESTKLAGLSDLGSDPRLQRGDAYWQLGLYNQASTEFDTLRKELTGDAVGTYRLMNHMLELGVYRQAIMEARQILTLGSLDDAASLNSPVFFNHIRFGTYFKDQVLPAAQKENINPLLLFSAIRQESLFEGFAYSSAGARGLMQIMPATGEEIANAMIWPPDYREEDLERPLINVTLGARYLARQRDYFDGDFYAALAGYNGGPGNAQVWKGLSNNDPDLFLEIIRYDESRNYVMQIADFLNIYNRLYSRTQ